MEELEAVEYERYAKDGRTITYSARGETLAHVDFYDDGVSVTVFKPYCGSMRTYAKREKGRALGIVARHLASEGYDMAKAVVEVVEPQEGPVTLDYLKPPTAD